MSAEVVIRVKEDGEEVFAYPVTMNGEDTDGESIPLPPGDYTAVSSVLKWGEAGEDGAPSQMATVEHMIVFNDHLYAVVAAAFPYALPDEEDKVS